MLAVPLLAACDGPLSTLEPSGPAARDAAILWWAMLAGSTLITLMVGVMLILAIRNKGGRASERHWIWGWGLGFTLSVLTVLIGFSLWLGERMLARADDALEVSAHAAQWEWRFTQPGPDGQPVATLNTLYVPAGASFDVVITSEDVIHSFWVPRLAGKMDAIPGRRNVLRIEAGAPGLYHGASAEFSGVGYAGMRFEVLAFPPEDPPAFADASAPTPALAPTPAREAPR